VTAACILVNHASGASSSTWGCKHAHSSMAKPDS
jgi:hypothetical protein